MQASFFCSNSHGFCYEPRNFLAGIHTVEVSKLNNKPTYLPTRAKLRACRYCDSALLLVSHPTVAQKTGAALFPFSPSDTKGVFLT